MKNKNVYIVSIISKTIFILLSFINSILINRYLGPSLKGEYSYLLNIINIITIVIGFNIASSYPYFSKKYGVSVKQEFINIIFIQTIIYIFISIILSFFINQKLWIYIIIISILFQFNNQLDFMSIISNINKRNKVSIISSCIYTSVLFILFLSTKSNLNYIIEAQILFIIVNSLLNIINNKLIPSIIIVKTIPLIEIIRFSFFPMITTLLTVFNYNIDIVILKLFVDDSNIGIYSVGVTLAAMLWVIPDAFKEVLFNKTAKDDSIGDIKISIKINIYVSLISIIGFILIGKYFILIVYGIDYINAYIVSIVLFIGTIPMIFFKIINTLYLAIGRQKYSFYILIISVLINVTLNFLVIPFMGILGAAISSVLSYMICGIIILVSFMKSYRVNIKEIFLLNNYEKDKIKKILLKK